MPNQKIGTLGGTTYWDSDTPVLVKVGISRTNKPLYTFQKPDTLKTGQQVSWGKEFINVGFEDVEGSLATEPSYAAAQESTFLINSNGQRIPRFTYHLNMGLWDLARSGKENLLFLVEISEKDLERIILHEGEDFLPKEYTAMARSVHYYLTLHKDKDGLHKEDGSTIVTEGAVRLWVKGEVNAPRERNVFFALHDVNPVFEKYLQSLPGQESPWEAYKLWVTVRQGLSRYLSNINGTKITEDLDDPIGSLSDGITLTESGKRISLSPYIKYVLGRVFENASKRHVNLLVTNVEPAADNLDQIIADTEEQPQPHYHQALVDKMPEDLEGIIVPYHQIPELLNVLTAGLHFGIAQYVTQPEIAETMNGIFSNYGEQWPDVYNKNHLVLTRNIADMLISYYNHLEQIGNKQFPKSLMSAQEAAANYLREEIFNGAFDKYFKLEKGTMVAVLQTASGLNPTLPDEYYEIGPKRAELSHYETLNFERSHHHSALGFIVNKVKSFTTKNRRSNLEEEVNELTERLESNYGLRLPRTLLSNTFFNYLIFGWDLMSPLLTQLDMTPYDLLKRPDIMERAKSDVLNDINPDDYMKRREATELLRSVGLLEILSLIPPTAFIDRVKVPSRT